MGGYGYAHTSWEEKNFKREKRVQPGIWVYGLATEKNKRSS